MRVGRLRVCSDSPLVVVVVARREVNLSLLVHRHEKRELQELGALKSLEKVEELKNWGPEEQ